jgi:hypothetical protein
MRATGNEGRPRLTKVLSTGCPAYLPVQRQLEYLREAAALAQSPDLFDIHYLAARMP